MHVHVHVCPVLHKLENHYYLYMPSTRLVPGYLVTITCLYSLQYETLVIIVTQLNECSREITFDLAGRAEYRDPERMERTVFVSPLSTNITPDLIKVYYPIVSIIKERESNET